MADKRKIGIVGLGSMGLPMAKNLVRKSETSIMGFDVMEKPMREFAVCGGVPVEDPVEIYENCDVVMQVLPTHETIVNSVKKAMEYGRPGNVVVDFSSTAPDIILELNQQVSEAGMHLLDSPISGGNPGAEAGTLAIMTGGEREIYDQVKPLLEWVGKPVYAGPSGSGSITKLINNIIAGVNMLVIAEAYAFGEKAGMDLDTVFQATRNGFAGGPVYENKVPKLIQGDYTPGARVAVHRKDIINAKKYAHKLGVDLPATDVLLHIMDWMTDNGYENEDQIAMVKYYEDKMNIKIKNE